MWILDLVLTASNVVSMMISSKNFGCGLATVNCPLSRNIKVLLTINIKH